MVSSCAWREATFSHEAHCDVAEAHVNLILQGSKEWPPQANKSYKQAMQSYGRSMPRFPPGEQCRTILDKWEDYLEKIGLIALLGAHRDQIAWLIKMTAEEGSNVAEALRDLRFDDQSMYSATLIPSNRCSKNIVALKATC